MEQYIKKSALVAEIAMLQATTMDEDGNFYTANAQAEYNVLCMLDSFIDTLEVKESLTWEDIRELYITFAEVDAEIEFCKCDIQAETIGYYQEVLKRFKAQKGE